MIRRRLASVTIPAVVLAALLTVPTAASAATPPAGAAAAGGPSWSQQLGATTWYTYPKTNLKDPTPLHTVTLDCGAQKTNGTALYPYIAPSGPNSYDYNYRNLSTKGVYVASDGFGHSGDLNGYLTVGNAHPHGDYAFSVSYECTANNPDNGTFTSSAAASQVTGTTAEITTEYYNNGNGDGGHVDYEVEYGPAAGDYTHTAVVNGTPIAGNNQYGALTAELTGLQPGTTYHFRTAEHAVGDSSSNPNYSADQSFTTAAD